MGARSPFFFFFFGGGGEFFFFEGGVVFFFFWGKGYWFVGLGGFWGIGCCHW